MTDPRRTRHTLLITLLVLCAGVGVVRWMHHRRSTPAGWQVVGRFQKTYHDTVGCLEGFLCRRQSGQYYFYDWQGHERWHVVQPQGAVTRLYYNYNISPSGHNLVLLCTQPNGIEAITYYDGQQRSRFLLPSLQRPDFLRVLDDGRVFVSDVGHVYFGVANGMLATATLPNVVDISASGTMLFGKITMGSESTFSCLPITVRGNRIVLGRAQLLTLGRYYTDWTDTIRYFAGVTVLPDGTRVWDTGRVVPGGAWCVLPGSVQAGNYLELFSTKNPEDVSDCDIVNPHTEEHWPMPLATAFGKNAVIDALSADGNTALVVRFGDKSCVKDGYLQEPDGMVKLLNRRRGVLAAMPTTTINRLLGKEQGIGIVHLSPDGEMLLVDTYYLGREEESSAAVLLRVGR